jgi:hypothetical protein
MAVVDGGDTFEHHLTEQRRGEGVAEGLFPDAEKPDPGVRKLE